MQARRAAFAHNAELGAAVVKNLTRVKVDAAVLKILTAVDVAGQLDVIAARGARYGLPGWTEEVEQRNGKHRVEYLDKPQAAGRAREFLGGASSPGEIAGRLLCLIAMARYADEARGSPVPAHRRVAAGRGRPAVERRGRRTRRRAVRRAATRPPHRSGPRAGQRRAPGPCRA